MTRNAVWRRVVETVCLACFLATVPVYSPNIMAVTSASSSDLTGLFVRTLLAAVTVCCAVFSARAFACREIRVRDGAFDGPSPRLHTAASALYALGCAGFFASAAFDPSSTALCVIQPVFALCAGIGFVPTAIGWAETLHSDDLARVLATFAPAVCLAALFNLCTGMLPQPLVAALCLTLLLAGTAAPLVIRRATREADRSETHPVESPDTAPEHPAATLRAFTSVMGATLLGMALSSLVMAIAPTSLFSGHIGAPETGMLVAGLVLLPFGRIGNRKPTYSFAHQVLLPCAAAAALMLAIFCQAGFNQDVTLLAAHTLYALTTLLSIATACAVSNAREFSRPFVFCTLIGTFTLCAVAGIAIGGETSAIAAGHVSVTLVLTAVYSLFILLGGCIKAWRLAGRPHDEACTGPEQSTTSQGASAQARMEERIALVAEEHGLTQREREILGLLGRGYSSGYIAKTLLISENTARTHVRNIHRKLGVSSRDELLQLVGGPHIGR